MSGHSKWKTIAHKKGAADAKRGKIFSRLSKEMMIAARQGGGNIEMNIMLRNVVQKARAANMPVDNIDRAIKKGTGELESAALEEAVYEGYASGGVGLIVVALTDNRKRAAAEIRHIFSKNGSSFASQGAVGRGFQRKGQIFVDVEQVEEEKLMDVILNAGAEDMKRDGDQYEILTEPSAFQGVVDALAAAEIPTVSAESSLVPDTYVPISDKSVASSILRFVNELEENDDVQDVYTNMNVGDEVLKEIEAENGD
ncbi:MAG: YebC/PmpR family DNA-binding transcriptional regulator [Lentisphaerales bacterium]|jgi:YebC/PmpR family DNA-binding regulatory protein|nr:MAG: YebC/PmpR family DNA-binding transcriptional regulator [Lentisphaerales bacterium]